MKLFLLFVIVAVITGVIQMKKEKKEADFRGDNIEVIAKQIGCTDVKYDPNGHFGTELFTPCEFLPRCQYFDGNQMLTGTWKGIPFRMGYGELSKDGTNPQGESCKENITIGRIIEIKTTDTFPVWFGIAHKKYTTYGIPYEGGDSKKAKDYMIKMQHESDSIHLDILDSYKDAINTLINNNERVSFGFTEHTIYVFIHNDFVFKLNKKNPEEGIHKEILNMTNIIDLLTNK